MRKPPAESKEAEMILPTFKSPREEAEWFDAHWDFLMERLKKHGKRAGPLRSPKPEPPTLAISLRVAVDDIAKAKEIAKKKGMGYQTVLKDLIREGLRK